MMSQEKETLLQAGVGWQDEMRSCHVTGERVRFREKNQTKKCEAGEGGKRGEKNQTKKCERGGKEGTKNREKKK